MRRLIPWLKYSGASISITVNPYHWRWLPWSRIETEDVWSGPNLHTWVAGWLMLTVRLWVDDGQW